MFNLSQPNPAYLMVQNVGMKKNVCAAQGMMLGTKGNKCSHTHILPLASIPPIRPWLFSIYSTRLAHVRLWKAHQLPPVSLCLCHLTLSLLGFLSLSRKAVYRYVIVLTPNLSYNVYFPRGRGLFMSFP